MKRMFQVLGVLVICLFTQLAYAGEAGSVFNKARFDNFMNKIFPAGYSIVDAEPLGEFWAVVVEVDNGSRREVVYITNDFEYLMMGRVYNRDMVEFTRHLLIKHAKRVDVKKIPDTAEFIIGNKEAIDNKTIHVFDDPACPFCARLHFELMRFVERNPDWKVAVHLYPLPGHGDAEDRAKVIHCAGDSPFVKESILQMFFNDILANKNPKYPKDVNCDMSDVEANVRFMQKEVKATGTPVMIMPDGKVINGYMSAEEIEDILKQ